jgi:fatty acid desaturase
MGNTTFGAGNKALSPETREQILLRMPEFTKLKPWRSFLAIVTDWLIIFAAILLSLNFPSLWMYLLAIIVIASRQHALLVIMHEATHLRLSRRRWLNDLLGELTCFPHFVPFEIFRDNHIKHHRYNCTDRDPDWVRLLPLEDWHFPKSGRRIAHLFIRYMYGYGVIEVLQLLFEIGTRRIDEPAKSGAAKRSYEPFLRVGLYLAIFGLLLYSHQLINLVLYWFVPFFFTLPPILRVRGIAEHYGLPMTHELNDTRNVVCGWLEQFILSPHSVNMHLDHHLFPAVPFYNLPRLHEFLLQFEDYRKNAHENRSYVLPSSHSLLKDLRTVKVEGPVFGFALEKGT